MYTKWIMKLIIGDCVINLFIYGVFSIELKKVIHQHAVYFVAYGSVRRNNSPKHNFQYVIVNPK